MSSATRRSSSPPRPPSPTYPMPARARAGDPVSHLTDVLSAARAEGRAALVGYLPAGYPSVAGAIDAITAMVRGGVDVVEIGLPYSDPLMDGPTIQRAAEQALTTGTTTADVLETVRAVSVTGAPTLVMTY